MFLFKKLTYLRLDRKRETASPATENTLSAGVGVAIWFA